ncbi:MAG: type 1 glutamine amidotransferase [Micrococcales bacterium]|nr:type 1 glutamine amidotransferase [Micrococcales bacterium]
MSDAPIRVLVVQHNLDDSLHELAGPLVDAGWHIDTWCTPVSDAPPGPVTAYDAVISLGAIASAADEADHPWMRPELELIQEALEREIPYLGVCFGAQILARAAGGEVVKGTAKEIGWTTVTAEPAAAHDPLVACLGDEFAAFHYHYDTFTLPDDATVLATTDGILEAFRVGESAWGVQFHVETNPSVVYGWLGSYLEDMTSAGVDIEQMRADTREHWREARERAWELAWTFVEIVRESRQSR